MKSNCSICGKCKGKLTNCVDEDAVCKSWVFPQIAAHQEDQPIYIEQNEGISIDRYHQIVHEMLRTDDQSNAVFCNISIGHRRIWPFNAGFPSIQTCWILAL